MPTETLMMKDSGIDCIAEIPENWDISRIKYDATFYNGDRSEEYPSGNDIIDEGIPFVNSENIHGTFLDVSSCKCITNEKYKRLGGAKLKINDIVFCLRGSVGNCSINKSINEGTVASSLVAIRANNINPDFLNYYLNSDSTVFQTSLFQNGSCAANLSAEKVSNYYICTPILKEQQTIADLLDEKCEKIDKVIGEIEEQIQILEDYKKSLITETVTKGFDKNVPMKDSGIDWIGKIPANWKISKIKYEYNIQTGGTPDTSISEYYDGENKWVTIADINEKVIYDTESKITKSAIKSCSMGISPKDSLLFSFKLSIGKVAFCGENLYTNEAIATFLKGVQPLQYLYYAAPIFIVKNANENIYGAKLLNQQLIKDAPIVLPPAEEQIKMADYLDKECEKIDKTINDKKEQLETIKEYKKSLNYEYVTGKKRVAC